jgi:glutamine synthetase
MYTDGHTVQGVARLPLNLLDALRAFEADAGLRAGLGAELASAYLKLRHADWNAYARHLTEWERETTLDC